MKLWSYEGAVLGACTLAFFATMAARLAISPVVPAVSEAFAVSNGPVGLALTGMWLAYAGAQFPSGLFADRYGERTIILVSVGGTALASAVLAVAPSYAVFFLGTVFLGAVAGLHFSVATSFLTRTLPNTGSAIGIHTAGAPAAGVLIPPAAGALGAALGWRWGIAIGTAVAIPAAILFLAVVKPTDPIRPEAPIRSRLRTRPLFELISRRPIARAVGLCACGAFVWQATASFLPAILVDHHGYSELVAGALFSFYFVVQAVTQPALGTLSDHIGRYPATALAFGGGIVGYALLAVGGAQWVLITAIGCAGVAMSWGAALLPKFMDLLGPSERSAGFGFIRTVYMVLGASGSAITGIAADVVGWDSTVVGLAVLLGGMFLAVVTLNDRSEQRIAESS